MADVGMKAVGKHYPGHGFVVPDSHHELPVDSREMSEIESDLIAFKELVDYGLGGIMQLILFMKIAIQIQQGFQVSG